jgi:hypothetical protein
MSNLEGPRFYDLFWKVASIEKRVTRLENGYHQLDNTLDPEGWIGEAFKLQEEDLETIKADFKRLFWLDFSMSCSPFLTVEANFLD